VDIAAQPGRGIGRDIGRGEAVERELDAFISKRHEQRVQDEGARLALEMWQESERRHAERRREEMRAAWCEHHQGQAARLRPVLEELIAGYEQQAERYRNQPKGAA
jgi:hypothetical protein